VFWELIIYQKNEKTDGFRILENCLEEKFEIRKEGIFFQAINLAAIKLQANQLDSAPIKNPF